MRGEIWKAALMGVAQGIVGSAVLFATSSRYTLANDWFLAVMIVFFSTTLFALAAWYGVRLIGVAVAGFIGMMAGGWVGVHTIGSYEYTVPAPPGSHKVRIVSPVKERRVIELKGMPQETVKRIPVGGGLGVLVGFAVGACLYARLARRADEEPPDDEEETPVMEPDAAPETGRR